MAPSAASLRLRGRGFRDSSLRQSRRVGAGLIALLFLASALAVPAVGRAGWGEVGSTSAHPLPAVPRAFGTGTARATIGPSRSADPTAASRVAAIERAAVRDGVPLRDLHLPNFAGQHAGRQGAVAPTYTQAPAPMGIADLGLTNVTGTLLPYTLDSPSVRGTTELTNAESVYVDGDGPDLYTLQFNAVAANVTLFGNSSYDFWTQDFATYSPSTAALSFGDNVWNFSNPLATLSPNFLFSHGVNGTVVAPVFYYAVGPTITVRYPFNVTFFLNSTVVADRPAVFFNYSLSGPSIRATGSFDRIVFNSSSGPPLAPAPVALFDVNGSALDPALLPNDVELTIGGDGGGDTTTFFAINATMQIDYWNSTAYAPYPSAYNFGSDTGETSDGVAVSWFATLLGFPVEVAHLTLGPSFLGGLWNISSLPGVRNFSATQRPINAFLFANPGTRFNASAAQWVPTMGSGGSNTTRFGLPNGGSYFFEWMLSDYRSLGMASNPLPNSTTLFTVNLTRTPALGVYTPLIAWGNAELAAIAQAGGNGTPAHPYVLFADEPGRLSSVFAAANEYLWPVFPGTLLIGTSASVAFSPPSFAVQYPAALGPTLAYFGLPSTNDLQLQFWGVSNVKVSNGAAISGWLPGSAAGSPAGELTLWNSTNDLVAANSFDDQGIGIALEGGTNITIWGNTFLATATGATNPGALAEAPNNLTGVLEVESGDVIYNNYYALPTPASTSTLDLASCEVLCQNATYTDTWNISRSPASASRVVLGSVLTGSIIQTSYQGGNYWTNYGAAGNPYGVLPYNDSGAITVGGDFVPLVPFELFTVNVTESGLAGGIAWNLTAGNVTTASRTTNLSLELPNGSYAVAVGVPPGYGGPTSANLTIAGNNTTLHLTFAALESLSFDANNLPPATPWTVTLATSTAGGFRGNRSAATSSIAFAVVPGLYNFSVAAYGFNASPAAGQVVVPASGATHQAVDFSPDIVLAIGVTGLPRGTPWSVVVTPIPRGPAVTVSSTAAELNLSVFDMPPAADYSYQVSATGYSAVGGTGTGALSTSQGVVVEFLPVLGTLDGSVSVPSATLWVNGVVIPITAGHFSAEVLPGVSSIHATAAGYAPYYNNVSVGSGTTTNVTINLTALPTTASGLGGISATGWAIIGVLAAVAVIAIVAAILGRRKSRSPPPVAPYTAAAPAGAATGAPPPSAPPRPPWEEDPADASVEPPLPKP